MHHDRKAFADPVEGTKGLAAGQHVVFADDLEPVDRRAAVENLIIMLRAKTQPKSEERRLDGIPGAACSFDESGVFRSACDVHDVHGNYARFFGKPKLLPISEN